MPRNGGKFLGPILIVVGLFMLLSQLGLPVFGELWPVFILAVGAGMLLRYRQSRQDAGLVFSGVLLILLAVFFQIGHWGWINVGRHWPFFVLAPGLSLLAMSRVDAKRRDAMVPGWIFVGAAAICYFFSLGFFMGLLRLIFHFIGLVLKVGVPLGLIALGAWMLFVRRGPEGGDRRDFPEKIDPLWPGAPADEPLTESATEPVTGRGANEADAAAQNSAPAAVMEAQAEVEDAEFEEESTDTTAEEPSEEATEDDSEAPPDKPAEESSDEEPSQESIGEDASEPEPKS